MCADAHVPYVRLARRARSGGVVLPADALRGTGSRAQTAGRGGGVELRGARTGEFTVAGARV